MSEEKTITYEAWIKPIFTGVIGLLMGVLLSSHDANISDNRFFLEKQVTSADKVANEFSRYILNWGRLIRLKQYVIDEKRNPTEFENTLFLTHLKGRDDARVGLFSAFDHLDLYFSSDLVESVDLFRDWDQEQQIKEIDSLPDIKEWQNQSKNILAHLRKEIIK